MDGVRRQKAAHLQATPAGEKTHFGAEWVPTPQLPATRDFSEVLTGVRGGMSLQGLQNRRAEYLTEPLSSPQRLFASANVIRPRRSEDQMRTKQRQRERLITTSETRTQVGVFPSLASSLPTHPALLEFHRHASHSLDARRHRTREKYACCLVSSSTRRHHVGQFHSIPRRLDLLER